MKCWKCGSDNVDTGVCLYCGATLDRTKPSTTVGKALRKIYNDFGYEKVFDDPHYITSAIGDLVSESDVVKHSIELVYTVGLGTVYKSQIRNSGEPDEAFYRRVRETIIDRTGFSGKKADQLIQYFDEMIGWDSSSKPDFAAEAEAKVKAESKPKTPKKKKPVKVEEPVPVKKKGIPPIVYYLLAFIFVDIIILIFLILWDKHVFG